MKKITLGLICISIFYINALGKYLSSNGQQQYRSIVYSQNKSLPQKMANGLTFTKIDFTGTALSYSFQYPYTKEDFPGNLKDVEANVYSQLKQGLCNNRDTLRNLSEVDFEYNYYDMNGKYLFAVLITGCN